MRRIFLFVLAAAGAGALVFAAASFGHETATLRGTVGPGFTIKLTKNGRLVRTLRPGRYTFVIRDRSRAHDFSLEKTRGGSFEKHLTTVGFLGTRTVTVRLTRGRWEYFCSPHEAQMHHEFAVR